MTVLYILYFRLYIYIYIYTSAVIPTGFVNARNVEISKQLYAKSAPLHSVRCLIWDTESGCFRHKHQPYYGIGSATWLSIISVFVGC